MPIERSSGSRRCSAATTARDRGLERERSGSDQSRAARSAARSVRASSARADRRRRIRRAPSSRASPAGAAGPARSRQRSLHRHEVGQHDRVSARGGGDSSSLRSRASRTARSGADCRMSSALPSRDLAVGIDRAALRQRGCAAPARARARRRADRPRSPRSSACEVEYSIVPFTRRRLQSGVHHELAGGHHDGRIEGNWTGDRASAARSRHAGRHQRAQAGRADAKAQQQLGGSSRVHAVRGDVRRARRRASV